MVLVTLLPQSRPLNRDDLERLPDDGHRYELIDGTLVVTPAPRPQHQRVLARLERLLAATCPEDLEVLFAPLDVVLADDTVVQPDILVARRADFTDRDLPVPPLLAVEILSPSTALVDVELKRARYERSGCRSYWVVDPDVPSITAWEVRDGRYDVVAEATGDEAFEVAHPFPVLLVPSHLTS